ncbi:MAG: alpha/beta fold hydrolase [Candidatus Methanofastidiosia archaeon]
MPKLKVNGIQMSYEVFGDGEPLVFIHGLGADREFWFFQVEEFSESFKVLTLDVRGHGESDKPNQSYSIGLFASDVATLLQKLNIEKANIVGLSMGGCIAQQLAIDHPEKVKSLVLVNTFSNLRPTTLSEVFQGFYRLFLVTFFSMKDFTKLIAKNLFPKPEQNELFLMTWKKFAKNPKKPYISSTNALFFFNSENQLSRIRCPTLVVAGEKDRTVRLHRKIHLAEKIPNAEFTIIRDSGHVTPLDKSEEFNRAVLEFLTKLRG